MILCSECFPVELYHAKRAYFGTWLCLECRKNEKGLDVMKFPKDSLMEVDCEDAALKVYCQPQHEELCAVHAVNNILQGLLVVPGTFTWQQ
jgi:hypothetical protein